MRRAVDRLLAGPQVVAVGLAVFLACGVLTALLGARLLPSAEYTVFAAFSGVLGVLVLGPASSLEQESALRAGAGRTAGLRRSMLARAAVVSLVVAAVALAPVAGWQRRLLDEQAGLALTALVLGAPFVLVLAVGRGTAAGRQGYRLVAAAHLVAGLATLALPLLLHAAGVALLPAFLLGAVLAWLPALLLVLGRERRLPPPDGAALQAVPGQTAWLVLANLLVLVTLLAVPPLLRWHVRDVGAAVVADVQLLVSVSRLSTTAVLGFLPLVLGRLGGGRGGLPTAAALAAACLGAVTVVGALLLGNPFIEVLTGRDRGLDVVTVLLATAPAVLLCPALVLMGAAVAARRYLLVCAAWAAGLVVLAATAALDPRGSVDPVLLGVLVASALPLAVLTAGLAAPRRPRVAA